MLRASTGIAVRILLTAVLVFGCRSPERHAAIWRGMRVDVGPEFVLVDEDTVLAVHLSPSNEPRSVAFVWFKSTAPETPAAFERGRSKCLANSKYDCELDSTSMAGAECFAMRDGWLADSTLTTTGFCYLRDRSMRAGFACANDACQRVRGIIARSFASLNAGKQNGQKSR